MTFQAMVAGWGENEEGWAVAAQWEYDGCQCFAVRRPPRAYESGPFNGYAAFPVKPVREPGYNGVLRYVPVHGGITYAEPGEDGGMAYGFDCAHADDEHKPELQNLEWVAAEVHRMIVGIKVATRYEDDFLLAVDGQARGDVLDRYHAELRERDIEFNLSDNFGAMIGVLGGLETP